MTPEPAWFAGDQGALWVIAHPALDRRPGAFLGILPKKRDLSKITPYNSNTCDFVLGILPKKRASDRLKFVVPTLVFAAPQFLGTLASRKTSVSARVRGRPLGPAD